MIIEKSSPYLLLAIGVEKPFIISEFRSTFNVLE
jgi:hypothetical protein